MKIKLLHGLQSHRRFMGGKFRVFKAGTEYDVTQKEFADSNRDGSMGQFFKIIPEKQVAEEPARLIAKPEETVVEKEDQLIIKEMSESIKRKYTKKDKE